eukprot:COSAG03_NODE_230_length_10295_cov_29.315026_1_plen_86_part_10
MLRVRDVSGRDDLKATWGGYMFFFVKGLAMLPNYAGQCSVCLCVSVCVSVCPCVSLARSLALFRFCSLALSLSLCASLSLCLPPPR